MAKPDLSGLSLEELNDLIEQATKQRDKKVEEKRSELLKELKALDAIKEPAKPSDGKKRSSPKHQYRGPEGETWSGRGNPPKWGAKYGAVKREDFERFRIKE